MRNFRKRLNQMPLPGTRTSPHTAQVVTSSGNPSLDQILGDGLPIGSICLIEEDRFGTHAKVLAKHFLAEGVMSKHKIFLASLDDMPAELLRRLPKPLNDDELSVGEQEQEQEAEPEPVDKNGLRIAFRYSDLPMITSEKKCTKIGHHFNMMEHMDSRYLQFSTYAQPRIWDDTENENQDLSSSSGSPKQKSSLSDDDEGNASTTTSINNNNNIDATFTDSSTANNTTSTPESPGTQSPSTDSDCFHNPRYGRLLNEVQQILRSNLVRAGGLMRTLVYRVCLTSLGSPLWYDEHFAEDLLKFLTILRASVRNIAAVCFITMPMHLIAKYDHSLVPKIRQLVDYAIELESFAGSERETHPAYKEYNGLLHLHKMSAINALAVHMPDTTDLAFKLRRKKFVIEMLHLPPDLQETSEATAAADILATPASNCRAHVTAKSTDSMDF